MVPIKTEPIPPAVVEEIETFEAEAMRMASGDVSLDLFRPFRLQYGITASGKSVFRWSESRSHSAG
jgi:hypothetical protein